MVLSHGTTQRTQAVKIAPSTGCNRRLNKSQKCTASLDLEEHRAHFCKVRYLKSMDKIHLFVGSLDMDRRNRIRVPCMATKEMMSRLHRRHMSMAKEMYLGQCTATEDPREATTMDHMNKGWRNGRSQ